MMVGFVEKINRPFCCVVSYTSWKSCVEILKPQAEQFQVIQLQTLSALIRLF